MKKLTVHRELEFSYASCYAKNGTPIANSPTSIVFTNPLSDKVYEIKTLVKEYIEKNGYDFEKVTNPTKEQIYENAKQLMSKVYGTNIE